MRDKIIVFSAYSMFICVLALVVSELKSGGGQSNRIESKLCQREFNQEAATVSVEHKSPILHKGTKPNRILIICQ